LGDTLLSVNYPDLTGDETTEPKAKRGLSRPLLKHGALAQAVLALAERHGSSLGGLRREVLDEELAQLLGLSAVRARHLLDEAYRSELKVGRGGEHGSARYVALAVRLVGGEQLLSARNQPHNLG
jgi:hypothetical protein